MRSKFLIYAVMVTVLSTGISWKRYFASEANDRNYSSSGRGSSWGSNTGGGWGGGGGGHK
ncbi:MAG: hypothetical protein ACXU7D_10260 [Burkholderiaceae bacterium]